MIISFIYEAERNKKKKVENDKFKTMIHTLPPAELIKNPLKPKRGGKERNIYYVTKTKELKMKKDFVVVVLRADPTDNMNLFIIYTDGKEYLKF